MTDNSQDKNIEFINSYFETKKQIYENALALRYCGKKMELHYANMELVNGNWTIQDKSKTYYSIYIDKEDFNEFKLTPESLDYHYEQKFDYYYLSVPRLMRMDQFSPQIFIPGIYISFCGKKEHWVNASDNFKQKYTY